MRVISIVIAAVTVIYLIILIMDGIKAPSLTLSHLVYSAVLTISNVLVQISSIILHEGQITGNVEPITESG